jgi:hypothetical protein
MYTVRSVSAAACLLFIPEAPTVSIKIQTEAILRGSVVANNCESSQVHLHRAAFILTLPCLLVLTHQCEVRNLIKLRSGSGVDRVM